MLSLSFNHPPRPKPFGTFRGHSEIVWAVVFLPNGKELVSASSDGSIRLWSLDHASEVILGSSNGAVFCLALFPDGRRLASGGLDRSVNVWDIDILTGVDGPWKGHTASVRYLDLSSDCRYLASGSFDHKVNIWDTENGRIVRDETYLTGDKEINCVKFSQKDCRLLTGSGDGCLRIWDWELGRLLVGPIKADETSIWAVAWSRDETQIFSGSGDGVLRRWQATTGRLVGKPVHAHESIIYSLSVSNNGGCLATTSSDNTAKIWNATTFEQMAILAHPGEVNCISFSADDRLLATACSDSSVYIWELPQASLDSGLVIRESDGSSLLRRPSANPLERDMMAERSEGSRRDNEQLRSILGQTPSPLASPESMDPDKVGPGEDVLHTPARNKRRTSRRQTDGTDNAPEPKKPRRKLSQIIRAIAKSYKFITSLW